MKTRRHFRVAEVFFVCGENEDPYSVDGKEVPLKNMFFGRKTVDLQFLDSFLRCTTIIGLPIPSRL